MEDSIMVELLKSRRAAIEAGHRRYFGMPCQHGHTGERRTKNYQCVECENVRKLAGYYRRRAAGWKAGHRPQRPNTIYRHIRRYLLLPSYRERLSPRLGCTGNTLRTHIESLWQPEMTWENYGIAGWQIDHRVPLGKGGSEHFTNLQPLWRVQNSRKACLLEPYPSAMVTPSLLEVTKP